MSHYRVLQPCITSWAYFRGWRAWRDRILYGHTTHSCSNLDDRHTGRATPAAVAHDSTTC